MVEFSAIPPLFLVTLLWPFFCSATAQSHYTLQQILSIADQRGTRIKIIENNALANREQAQMYLADALPKIELSSGLSYSNQTLRGNQVSTTVDILSIFDRLDGLMVNWSLSLKQPLFSFGKTFNSLKLASLGKDILEQNRLLQRDIFFLQVIEQYTITYIDQFELNIAKQSLARSQKLLEKIQLDYEFAHSSRMDLLRTKSAFAGNAADSIRAATAKLVSRQKLNVMIGLPDTCEYELVLDTTERYSEKPDMRKSGNIEITLKLLETRVNDRLRRNAWASLWPSLSLTASINNEIFTIDTTGLTGLYLAYMEQNGGLPPNAPEVLFPENPGPGEYFNPDFFNYSAGVLLTWNIFDGTRSWAAHRQAKLKEGQSKLELEQMRLENSNKIMEIKGQISTLIAVIEAYRLQYLASQKALEQAEMDIKDGFIDAGTYLEIDREYNTAARQLDEAKLQKLLLQAQLQVTLGLPVYKNE